MSLHQASLTVSAAIWQCAVSVLRYGHGGEDQADETENEQIQAGSGLWLQTGTRLPQGKNMSGYAECMLHLSRSSNMYLQYTVCMVALCRGHMAHFTSSQACTHAHINIILCVCTDVCTLFTHRQSHKHTKTGKHSNQFKDWSTVS